MTTAAAKALVWLSSHIQKLKSTANLFPRSSSSDCTAGSLKKRSATNHGHSHPALRDKRGMVFTRGQMVSSVNQRGNRWRKLRAVISATRSLPVLRETEKSFWICELSQTKALAAAVVKPYLRNLFYRILRLHVEYGVSLVFVIDGAATPMKWATMDRRMAASGQGKEGGRTTKIRHQLNSRVREVTYFLLFSMPMLLSCCIERKSGCNCIMIMRFHVASIAGNFAISSTCMTCDCTHYSASTQKQPLVLLHTSGSASILLCSLIEIGGFLQEPIFLPPGMESSTFCCI